MKYSLVKSTEKKPLSDDPGGDCREYSCLETRVHDEGKPVEMYVATILAGWLKMYKFLLNHESKTIESRTIASENPKK
jgi:hypothetical protein